MKYYILYERYEEEQARTSTTTMPTYEITRGYIIHDAAYEKSLEDLKARLMASNATQDLFSDNNTA